MSINSETESLQITRPDIIYPDPMMWSCAQSLGVNAISRHRRNELSFHFVGGFLRRDFFPFPFSGPHSSIVSSAETALTIIYWFLCALSTQQSLCEWFRSIDDYIVCVVHARTSNIPNSPTQHRRAYMNHDKKKIISWPTQPQSSLC